MRYSRNILISLFVLCSLSIGSLVYYSRLSNKAEKSPPNVSVQELKSMPDEGKTQPSLSAANPLETDDFSLKGIRLGDSLDTVLAKFGEPKLKRQTQEGISYTYTDFEVIISAQNIVINVLTNTNTTATRRNIHPGSTLTQVKARYGENCKQTDVNGLELYEYTFQNPNNNSYILRFGVQADTAKVNYIGSRSLNEVIPSQYVKIVKYCFNSQENKLVLLDNDIMLKVGDKLVLVQEGSNAAVGLASNSDSDYTKLFTVFNSTSVNGDITLVAKAPGRNSVLLWVLHDAPAAVELMVTVSGE